MNARESAFDVSRFAYCWQRGCIVGVLSGAPVSRPHGQGGYRTVCARGVRIMEHRLVWRLVTGAWPDGELDHCDGNGSNNRFENLRLATSAQNKANRGPQANNRSGEKGVCLDTFHKLWTFAVSAGGRRVQGKTRNPFSAIVASRLARRLLHGEFALESRARSHAAGEHARAKADLYA